MDGAHPQPQPLDGNSVLLVVDDYPENLISMRALLARQDWQVLTASSGREALSALLEHDVDLVLLDVQMPEMDGFEVARLMRGSQRTRLTPIIFLTANEQSEAAVLKGYASGAVDYMFKPFDPQILKPKVQALLDQQRNWRMLQRLHQQLEYQAVTDPLTGLLNRRGFYQAAEGALLRNERSDKAQALMYMDLDGFKRINDSLGHETGDRVLRWVAEQLKDCLGSEALLARMGGDEFIALFDSLPYPEQAGRYAEKLLERISISHQVEGLDVCLGVSIGIATYPDCGVNVEGLLRAADAAMYAAKQAGRQQYRFYDQELNGRARSRLMLEDSVRAAIEQQDFTLVYQPQVGFADGHLRGFEALLRWQHPSVGDVPPGLFIPLLEEARLISRLASWIYRQGAAQRRAWCERFPADLVLGISLSRAQFVMPSLVDELQRVIQLYQLDPVQLEVEVAETSLVDNIDAAVKQIHRLRELGVRVALDDFGAGGCSLRLLRDLPIDTLKLDRHLVARLPGSEVDAALVRSVVGLCADYRITVVAEGVETPAQAAWLKANGCAYVQGFLVAHPMTAADASGFPAIFPWPRS